MIMETKRTTKKEIVKMLLKNANFEYDLIDSTENIDLCKSLGVKNAPTLLIPNGEMMTMLQNVSEIKKYIEDLKK